MPTAIDRTLNELTVQENREIDERLQTCEFAQDSLNDEDTLTLDEIGFFLKTSRETLGLTVIEMAEELGINKNTYSKYESGKREPRNLPVILATVTYAIKRHFRLLREKDLFVFRDYLGELTVPEQRYIEEAHLSNTNIVKIAIALSISENVVRDYLVAKGYEPIEFRID